jgi:hypothetical protein
MTPSLILKRTVGVNYVNYVTALLTSPKDIPNEVTNDFYSYDQTSSIFRTKRSATNILDNPIKHQRRKENLNHTAVNSHAEYLVENYAASPVTLGAPTEDPSISEPTSDDWFTSDDSFKATVEIPDHLDLENLRQYTAEDEFRLKAAAELLSIFGISEQAYSIYLMLENQNYSETLRAVSRSINESVSADLVRLFLTDTILEICGVRRLSDFDKVLGRYEIQQLSRELTSVEVVEGVTLLDTVENLRATSTLSVLLSSKESDWMWQKKVGNVLNHIGTNVRAKNFELSDISWTVSEGEEINRSPVCPSVLSHSISALESAARAYHGRHKYYQGADANSVRRTRRFKVLRDYLMICSAEPNLDWEDRETSLLSPADAVSRYFILYRLIWTDLYHLRLGPASSFSLVTDFENFSGYAIAELAAILVGLVGKHQSLVRQWNLGPGVMPSFRLRFNELAETLSEASFEEAIQMVPSLNLIIPQQVLLDFVVQETKVCVSNLVSESTLLVKTNHRRFEDMICAESRVAPPGSPLVQLRDETGRTEMKRNRRYGKELKEKDFDGKERASKDQGKVSTERETPHQYSTLAPSISFSNSSFRNFKLLTHPGSSMDSCEPQLPSTAIRQSRRSSNWSLISDFSKRFSHVSISSKDSRLSR